MRPPCAQDVRLFDDHEFAWRRAGPSEAAVSAFGVGRDELRRLAGGHGHAWTDGRLVMKPVGCLPEHDWVCQVYAEWSSDAVRVPCPVRPSPAVAGGADWSVDGWAAHELLPGRDADPTTELGLIRQASGAFHAALADVPRPGFLDVRNDPWAFGDRVAWDGVEPAGDTATLELIGALTERLGPVAAPSQPIHGDILPNVLVAAGLPPAVIDWPVYFRPSGLGEAIAILDAVTFRGAPPALLDEWGTGEEWTQLLVRALLYRLGATGLIASRDRLMGSLVTHTERARPVVQAVLAR